MIVGIGTDIVSMERIDRLWQDNADQFAERICLPEEKKYVYAGEIKAGLAKVWAAKEAAVKALGTGFSDGVRFKDIELKHDGRGKPELEFSGRALEILNGLSNGKKVNVMISLSDDKPFAQAVVIIEKI